jgi:galactarate dehydratase
VQCVASVADYIVRRVKEELLPLYPNVDDVVALNHTYGCGIAINAPGAIVPIRTLQNITLNPNLGGEVMIISLGCEKLQPRQLMPAAKAGRSTPGEPGIPFVCMQDEAFVGFGDMVAAMMKMAGEHLARLNKCKRVTCPASDLVVGLQCGGSDAFSGVTANPAVGFAADLIVRAGGTVMFSEVTEVRDAIHLLTPRAIDESVAKDLLREMAWYDRYLEIGGADRSANPSPGNKAGGLANVVEKSLGSVAKSGSSPIVDVLGPGERMRRKGLIFAATPAGDFVCGTLQLAAGMNLEVFTTGRGAPYGLALAPVVKVSSRTSLKERWHDLIDIDAGRIATGQASIADVGWELFHLILDVASGRKKVAADRLGLHNDLVLFNPAPVT